MKIEFEQLDAAKENPQTPASPPPPPQSPPVLPPHLMPQNIAKTNPPIATVTNQYFDLIDLMPGREISYLDILKMTQVEIFSILNLINAYLEDNRIQKFYLPAKDALMPLMIYLQKNSKENVLLNEDQASYTAAVLISVYQLLSKKTIYAIVKS